MTFFVIYNYRSAEVIAFYDNASREFLALFEKTAEMFKHTAYNEPFAFITSCSNNLFARRALQKHMYAVQNARNGG
jgi:hypothetical protein